MQKYSLILLILSLFVLSGCITLEGSIEINKDGSGVNRVIMAVDSGFYTSGSFDDLRQQAIQAGATVEDYSSGGRQGVIISRPFKNLKELSTLSQASDVGANPDIFQINADRSGGLFKRIYSIEIQVDTAKFKETDAPSGLFDNNVLQAMDFGYSVTLPGKIIAHNGTKVEEGKVNWEMNAASGQVYILTAKSELETGIPVGLILGIAVLAVVGGAVLFIRRGNASTTGSRHTFCTQCGTQNQANSKFCTKCGNTLSK